MLIKHQTWKTNDCEVNSERKACPPMKLQLNPLIYILSLSLSDLYHLHVFYHVILNTTKTISTSSMLVSSTYRKKRKSFMRSPRPSKYVYTHNADAFLELTNAPLCYDVLYLFSGITWQ